MRPRREVLFSALFAVAVVASSSAGAQTGADFYKDKTVTYIVATAPGGGYDTYGRLICEYMQKYLPGSTFVVKNLPGAGHLVGTNTIYASKADGLTIGTFNTGLLYNQLMNADGVRFDLMKMSWIGKAGSDPRMLTVKTELPLKTLKEIQSYKEPLSFSTSGVGSAAYVETVMLTKALKLPASIKTGYNGYEDQLAMRRGEIHAAISSRSSWESFVKSGYGRFIVQIGGSQSDVPQLSDYVSDPESKALVALVQSQGDISRLTAGPPNIPADRLEALREAYRKALNDPELQARAEKLERPVDPAFGDDVLAMIKAALNQSPATIAILKEAMASGSEKVK